MRGFIARVHGSNPTHSNSYGVSESSKSIRGTSARFRIGMYVSLNLGGAEASPDAPLIRACAVVRHKSSDARSEARSSAGATRGGRRRRSALFALFSDDDDDDDDADAAAARARTAAAATRRRDARGVARVGRDAAALVDASAAKDAERAGRMTE
jgi:hypothetical protein